jgi:DNA-binding NarL/FixJ family response regulator
VNTVKVHLRNTLEKLELRNRQQLAAFAVSHGLITDIRGEDRFEDN